MVSIAPVLSVEHLTVHRGSHRAVQDVSFSLEAGMDMAIIGPNGAGKSTLIQAILGLLPSHAGQVTVLGQCLGYSLGRSQGLGQHPGRQYIAYLPQNFLVDQRIPMTVAEFVGLGWDHLGWQWPWTGARDRHLAIRQALYRVEATHLRQHPISSLSGGEIKRILLAYCLIRPRKLLILDEAPAGLDLRGEAEFYQLLNQLKREQGWSILQISHNLDMVRRHCDRVLCLNQKLLSQGPPADILSPQILAAAYGHRLIDTENTPG